MGYYIETTDPKGKADTIVSAEPSAIEVTLVEAREAVKKGEGVVVVVDNGPFEAAGFAYNLREFRAFTRPDDPRPKRYIKMDYGRAAKLSGYRK